LSGASADACRSNSHIEVTPETNGNLFFWHFQNKHVADRQRTVIWLNGGPGCSSEDGALMEIGPYRVVKDSKLVENEGSWNEFANLLFVDNPVGTGYSYVDTDSYIHELDTMAEQFIIFLEKFFGMFPEYENDDVSIFSSTDLVTPLLTILRSISLASRMLVNIFPTLPKLF
jgi:carboxypeptidase D